MRALLDTGILIDQLRGRAAAMDLLAGLERQPASSEISRIEVIQGLRSHEREAAERLFSLIEWIEVSEEIARQAGEFGRRWRRSHPGIGAPDLAIAATAESLGAELLTHNLKHFPMFPGLEAPY